MDMTKLYLNELFYIKELKLMDMGYASQYRNIAVIFSWRQFSNHPNKADISVYYSCLHISRFSWLLLPIKLCPWTHIDIFSKGN